MCNLFNRIIITFRLLQCDVYEIRAYFRSRNSNKTDWIFHKRMLSCESDIQHIMLSMATVCPVNYYWSQNLSTQRDRSFLPPRLCCQTRSVIQWRKTMQFKSEAISLNIISVGKMKRKDHAVWGNCSAKWLFPSHCQAASLHINGRPGYLSGTHINLVAYRHRARRRLSVGCCYQSEMCCACLSRPPSLCTVEEQSCSHCSEDWSLSLEKSLKELQEPGHRFFLDYCTFI